VDRNDTIVPEGTPTHRNAPPWQFWIDVGGTFTDCIARSPDGKRLRHKVLSSGVTKGVVGAASAADVIWDPDRRHDPVDFWTGCEFRLLDRQGRIMARSEVIGFDNDRGKLQLAQPLAAEPPVGRGYELCGQEEAPLLTIRYLLGLPLRSPLPPVAVRLGTTRGTNALITRRGARAALVTTAGFADLLRIGYQNRPRLFDLAIRRPSSLFAAVAEIDERIDADGRVREAPTAELVRETLRRLKDEGIESLAVCLLNAYANPEHEEFVGKIARDVGFDEISL
jgi:5-oxoprolinase (ATP-hydrolysing)